MSVIAGSIAFGFITGVIFTKITKYNKFDKNEIIENKHNKKRIHRGNLLISEIKAFDINSLKSKKNILEVNNSIENKLLVELQDKLSKIRKSVNSE